jgi:hypothetical protein
MRHPFDGVEETKSQGRRGFLGSLLGLGVGLLGVVASCPAAAPPKPQASTERLGEEGGIPSTTAAFEEGGRPPRHITEALHEDGRWLTTLKEGEEGGKKKR